MPCYPKLDFMLQLNSSVSIIKRMLKFIWISQKHRLPNLSQLPEPDDACEHSEHDSENEGDNSTAEIKSMRTIDCDKCKASDKREAVCYCVDCNKTLCNHHETVSDWSCARKHVRISNSYIIEADFQRLANRLFQNNWIFPILVLVQRPLFILFRFFFSFPIVFEKGVILRNRTAQFRPKTWCVFRNLSRVPTKEQI